MKGSAFVREISASPFPAEHSSLVSTDCTNSGISSVSGVSTVAVVLVVVVVIVVVVVVVVVVVKAGQKSSGLWIGVTA